MDACTAYKGQPITIIFYIDVKEQGIHWKNIDFFWNTKIASSKYLITVSSVFVELYELCITKVI